MAPAKNENREPWIRLIEKQALIENRYSKIKRLTENAGEGNFSLMFTALDSFTGRKVALKFFNPTQSGSAYRVDCFEREVRILQIFKEQPNILQIINGKGNIVLDIGQQLTFPLQFFAAELAQGSLEDYICSSKTSATQNLLFFREACKAVQRIHAKQVCHRDLKPGNFLVFLQKDPRNKLRLSDFGTARSFDKKIEPLLQSYERPVGDYAYTSPELLCGLHSEEQCAFCNDLYSLGAILFEMFTKINLNLILFNDIMEIRRLVELFRITRERDRKEIFHNFIKGIARSKPLPDIFAFNGGVPNCIKNRLNALYKFLANLDYRRRLGNFTTVFRQLNICLIILHEEEKYRKWKELKKKFKKQGQYKVGVK